MSSKAFQSFGTYAVFRIAFSLMVFALTSTVMLFWGRMVLAKYDIHVIASIYGFLGVIIVVMRYHRKKWIKLDLSSEEEITP